MKTLRNLQKRIKYGSQKQDMLNYLNGNQRLFEEPTIRKTCRNFY
ncbi:MAG: hypothetical protein V7655_01380 [Aequorivita antarctica]